MTLLAKGHPEIITIHIFTKNWKSYEKQSGKQHKDHGCENTDPKPESPDINKYKIMSE
ncbi:hypothetical protein [Kiloniella majae]|uniref:hypothetical protein n=1 Tax=Kiloniella majae TaxID=1938558 RepID=UPI0015C5137A|nr:hypothetical protein [Kiloniella majae]